MKILTFLLLIILPVVLKAQDTARCVVDTTLFTGANYRLEWSKDSTIFSGASDYVTKSTVFTFLLPPQTGYFRIVASGSGINYYTSAIFVTATNNAVSITNAVFKVKGFSDVLSWTTTIESNVSYYLIEKSTDGKSYSTVIKISDKGNANYSYSVSRFFTKKPVYRLTAFYFDGTKTIPVPFKN